MEQKRVSFKVAKAIKEAGYDYPCDMYYHMYDDEYDSEMSIEATGDGSRSFLNSLNQFRCAAPFVTDVWLWLWREKQACIGILFDEGNCAVEIWSNKSFLRDFENKFDPEEAIIAAIEYLVDNDLIK